MIKNLGSADRIIRTIAALVIGYLIITGTVNGLAAVILGVVVVALLLTSLLSFCPFYLPFKISTNAKTVTK
jgi:hypothetical protein